MGNRNSYTLVARSLGLVLLIFLIRSSVPHTSAKVLPPMGDYQWNSPQSSSNSPVLLAGVDDWTLKSPTTKPSVHFGQAMANIGGDQVLLFGGYDGLNDDETWVYDLSDNTWTLKAPATKPSARQYHAMAYIGGDQVLLFGGWDGAYYDETWVYDLSANTWTLKSPVEGVKPSARYTHAIADIGGDQVLLFGGWDTTYDDETWVYGLSDNTWTKKSPTSKPSARRYHAMANIGGEQVLLFGGDDGPLDDETWVYLSAHEIFSDDFESGDLTAWDSAKTSRGDMKACAKAPITGAYSLCVKNKTNKTKFVKDDGFTESAYSFQFNLDPNGIKVKNKKKIRLVQAQGSKNTTWIEFRRKTGAYQIRAWAALDGGGKTKTGWKTISNAPHLIEVDWSAATAAGADDGFLKFYIDDVLKQQLSSLNNDTYDVQKIKLGITKTVPNFTEKFYLDDFVSTDGGHIGP